MITLDALPNERNTFALSNNNNESLFHQNIKLHILCFVECKTSPCYRLPIGSKPDFNNSVFHKRALDMR